MSRIIFHLSQRRHPKWPKSTRNINQCRKNLIWIRVSIFSQVSKTWIKHSRAKCCDRILWVPFDTTYPGILNIFMGFWNAVRRKICSLCDILVSNRIFEILEDQPPTRSKIESIFLVMSNLWSVCNLVFMHWKMWVGSYTLVNFRILSNL